MYHFGVFNSADFEGWEKAVFVMASSALVSFLIFSSCEKRKESQEKAPIEQTQPIGEEKVDSPYFNW